MNYTITPKKSTAALIDFSDDEDLIEDLKPSPPLRTPPPPSPATIPSKLQPRSGSFTSGLKPILPPNKPHPAIVAASRKRPQPPPKPKGNLLKTLSSPLCVQDDIKLRRSSPDSNLPPSFRPLSVADMESMNLGPLDFLQEGANFGLKTASKPTQKMTQQASSVHDRSSPRTPPSSATLLSQIPEGGDRKKPLKEAKKRDASLPDNVEGILVDLAPANQSPTLPRNVGQEVSELMSSITSPVTSTTFKGFRRPQPVCLPKPPSRELEYVEREHPKNAFSCLNAMRNRGELCDVVLTVDEKEIHAHKVVLAACSSYFLPMFTGEFTEPDGVPIVIEEVEEDALIALVDFAYTSKIKITHRNVYSLFEAADILLFQGVKNACFKFFKSQMNKSNCIRTWLFADCQNCTELIEASLKYIECNFLDIIRGQEFLLIEPETVARIVDLEDLAISCEEQVYEAVLGWLYHNIDQRSVHAAKLFKNVRFPSIEREYLMHIVDHEPVIRNDPDCLQMLIDALKSHMTSARATIKKKLKKQGSKYLPRAASMAVEQVELVKKKGSPLGLTIMGGSDKPTHVFRQGDKPGIFVREITPASSAAANGKLRIGDRILSVSGKDVSYSTHENAILLLLTSSDPVTLLVRHEPPPPGLKELTLVTKPGEGFGFSISGGVNGHPSNPFDETDEGIFISQIVPGGAAERDGRLKVGTRILQVNSISIIGMTHEEALKALQCVLDRMSLLACDGYDPSAVPSMGEFESTLSWAEEGD